MKPHMIAAALTPVTEDDSLCASGLAQHLAHVWDAGVEGVLIAGSMGLMQMQRDQTWAEMVKRGSELSRGRGEVLLGVGDAATGRVLDRLEVTNPLPADGVVVLTPYLWTLDDDALFEHYRRIAEASSHPVYLYDLPALTGRPIPARLMHRLADVKNIVGIKCSGAPDLAMELKQTFGARFRIVLAQPLAADIYLRSGYREQLDGIYALAPRWAASLARSAERGDWDTAAAMQAKMTELIAVIRTDVYPTCDVLWRARGWEGRVIPAPFRPLSQEAEKELLKRPIARDLLETG